MKKTKYASFCNNGMTEGCKYCVKGEKLVLFISGKCSRNCWYCSLSNKRKNSEKIWANEREIHDTKELIEEAEESNATSAGITGGDPLLFLDRTIEFASALKSRFGEKFHIHIYLPTKLVTLEKLTRLEEFIDEVRFHPEFLLDESKIEEDVSKIKMAERVFGKQNIGIELPMIPDKKEEIKEFILKVKDYIDFVNLNEFEYSETNCAAVEKKYELDKNGYTIKGSIKAGKWILDRTKKLGLKIHLCSAELKNWHQYKNRLLRHKILPFGNRMKDGTVEYLILDGSKNDINEAKKLLKECYYDKKKNRLLLTEREVKKMKAKGYKVERVEEYPTYDGDEVER